MDSLQVYERDRPVLEITQQMIEAAASVLRDSGRLSFEVTGPDLALAAEVVKAAILAA